MSETFKPIKITQLKIGGLLFLIFCSGCSLKKEAVNPIVYNQSFRQVFANKTIEVVAPGSGTSIENIKNLEELTCFHLNIPQNLVAEDIPLHANLDNQRYLFLKNALFNPSKNTIIWALRGGYGSGRLIDRFEKLKKPRTEKLFIGFSDNTALHLFLSQKWHWKTIHGAGLVEILNPDKSPNNFERIAEIVSGKTSILTLNNLKPLNDQAKKLKEHEVS